MKWNGEDKEEDCLKEVAQLQLNGLDLERLQSSCDPQSP